MFSKLNNYYWFIRCTRDKALRRKYYRWIAKEKKRLVKESGVDAEYLRLYCRALSDRHNEHAEKRFAQYKKENFLTY